MIIIWIFLAAWWIVWLMPVPRKTWWITLCYGTVMTFLLLYAGIVTMGVYYDGMYPWHTVQQACTVRMGPDISYGVVAPCDAGQRVRVIHTNGSWRKIENAAVVGWVPVECLVG